MSVDADHLAAKYRRNMIDIETRRILVSRIGGSAQEGDLTAPVNASGLGRVRHFRRRGGSEHWPDNPLPIDPAVAGLGLPPCDLIEAQVFQNAACNWRCWYCYVPFSLLAAAKRSSAWMSADELVDQYLALPNRPPVLDLSGGQPDLTPEWVPWTLEALRERNMEHAVYVWSDDNLSNDYFWRFLKPSDRELIRTYENYARVGCFKGFDSRSFEFNTNAPAEHFDRQFKLFERLIHAGIDMFGYVTLTHAGRTNLRASIGEFVDRLQSVHPNLPLRTVPLEIAAFGPVDSRLTPERRFAMEHAQHDACALWLEELASRFSDADRMAAINSVPMGPV